MRRHAGHPRPKSRITDPRGDPSDARRTVPTQRVNRRARCRRPIPQESAQHVPSSPVPCACPPPPWRNVGDVGDSGEEGHSQTCSSPTRNQRSPTRPPRKYSTPHHSHRRRIWTPRPAQPRWPHAQESNLHTPSWGFLALLRQTTPCPTKPRLAGPRLDPCLGIEPRVNRSRVSLPCPASPGQAQPYLAPPSRDGRTPRSRTAIRPSVRFPCLAVPCLAKPGRATFEDSTPPCHARPNRAPPGQAVRSGGR